MVFGSEKFSTLEQFQQQPPDEHRVRKRTNTSSVVVTVVLSDNKALLSAGLCKFVQSHTGRTCDGYGVGAAARHPRDFALDARHALRH